MPDQHECEHVIFTEGGVDSGVVGGVIRGVLQGSTPVEPPQVYDGTTAIYQPFPNGPNYAPVAAEPTLGTVITTGNGMPYGGQWTENWYYESNDFNLVPFTSMHLVQMAKPVLQIGDKQPTLATQLADADATYASKAVLAFTYDAVPTVAPQKLANANAPIFFAVYCGQQGGVLTRRGSLMREVVPGTMACRDTWLLFTGYVFPRKENQVWVVNREDIGATGTWLNLSPPPAHGGDIKSWFDVMKLETGFDTGVCVKVDYQLRII